MNVETKELEFCKMEIKYEGDPDVVRNKYDEAVADLRKEPVAGFRKGKAPDYAILARKRKIIERKVMQEMTTQAYDDVIFETKIKPIGQPMITDVKLKGNKFTLEMIMMKKPEFQLKPYKEYEIPKPDINRDTIAGVEAALHNLRIRMGDVVPYGDGDSVERGDQITMDFEATIDGKPFQGSTAEGLLYTVGENALQKDFDDGIQGMNPGEVREFDITFPAELSDLGGKVAHFKVTVHMGTKRHPAPLDDELAKKCGADDLAALRKNLDAIAANRIQNEENNALRQQISQRLVTDNEFEVPEYLLDIEYRMIAGRIGADITKINDEQKEALRKNAKDNVKLSLILDSIREEESDAVLSDAEAQQALAQRWAMQGADPKKMMVEAQQAGVLPSMVDTVKSEFTLQWLVSKAKIIE